MPSANLLTNLNLPPGNPQPAGEAEAPSRMTTRASSKAPEVPPSLLPTKRAAALASKSKQPANASAAGQSTAAGKRRAQPAAAAPADPPGGANQQAGEPAPNQEGMRPPALLVPPAEAGMAPRASGSAQPLEDTVAALWAHIRLLEAQQAAMGMQRRSEPAMQPAPQQQRALAPANARAPPARAPPAPQPANHPPTRGLVADPAVVEWARAAVSAHTANESVPAGQLPDIVPGYHTDILSIGE